MPEELPAFKEVYSSDVAAVAYKEKGSVLYVKWVSSGKISAYTGVPAQIAKQVMSAWSVGQAVANQIKKVYPHRYVQ